MEKTMEHAVLSAVTAHPGAFRLDMEDWLRRPENWLVWAAFEYHANEAWNKGRRHYSARTIGEYLRHHTLLSDTSSDFKLNDHVFPELARLYMFLHPGRSGFFEVRNSGIRRVA